jgi:hypothetical protein
MSCANSKKLVEGSKCTGRLVGGSKCTGRLVGGDGHMGHTVFDTVYHGRPEYGFYSANEMTKMGAKVGGSMKGGSGHMGHTVFDTVYHGRSEYGFYSANEMTKMGAKVGGSRRLVGGSQCTGRLVGGSQCTGRLVGGSQCTGRLVGGFNKESMDEHLNRIKGIIENMIDVSRSPDQDIIEVIGNELNPKTNSRYGKREATKLLNVYYELNPHRFNKKQKGGNRVTLPLSFYTGEIPNKINVSIPTSNYCA